MDGIPFLLYHFLSLWATHNIWKKVSTFIIERNLLLLFTDLVFYSFSFFRKKVKAMLVGKSQALLLCVFNNILNIEKARDNFAFYSATTFL